ncbi:nucleotidyl transferase AbiEii/AbiGii toxin family protein [Streptomyces sp. NBC_00820]|uniref:nucleotidyl transferase AbiEii/AbiGii toxin family protein n=1 Tax=Streptomyces sp. NBC_00820 TaxID=2975842 RepID=UPI002ED1F5FB|nr:nucleotidyl transferase AbiEii/AbiGii toxin family protein [Streptomyces sp. NBC_00820]
MPPSDGGEAVRRPAACGHRAARRAALDHVLRLVADAPWSGGLVLRGSMAMQAWVGGAAREPADLDWVVLEGAVAADPLDPFPYVDRVEAVQQWPEAAAGAARYEMWTYEEFDTAGQRPVLPPEGLHWMGEEDLAETCPPYRDLLERVARSPQVAPGLTLDPEAAREDGTWTYTEYDTPGVRLLVPWHADGLGPGEVQLDFARDEALPESPVWTPIPQGAGGGPTPVRTVSRDVALAWKLLWLHIDSRDGGRARGKDLYDAALLAGAAGARLPAHLLRRVFRRAGYSLAAALRPGALVRWDVDWDGFQAEHPWVPGTAEEWLRRLDRALAPVIPQGPSPA